MGQGQPCWQITDDIIRLGRWLRNVGPFIDYVMLMWYIWNVGPFIDYVMLMWYIWNVGSFIDYVMLMWYIWISWWCLPSSEFYFLRWASLIGPITKTFGHFPDSSIKKTFTPNIETHKSQYSITYVGSKMTTLDKAYGTKWGAIGNVLRNTFETWGTCWEPIGNNKIQKNPTDPAPLPTALANVRGMNCASGNALLKSQKMGSH